MKHIYVRWRNMLAFLAVSFVMLMLHSAVPLDEHSRYRSKIEKELRKFFPYGIRIEAMAMEGDGNYLPDGTIFRIVSEGRTAGYYSVRRAKGCKIGGCTLNKEAHLDNSAKYEHFDYLAIFAPDATIVHVAVLEYRPEQGYEICNRNWLKQFAGRNGTLLEYGANVDAISGATTSAFSITYDLSVQSHALMKAVAHDGIE